VKTTLVVIQVNIAAVRYRVRVLGSHVLSLTNSRGIFHCSSI